MCRCTTLVGVDCAGWPATQDLAVSGWTCTTQRTGSSQVTLRTHRQSHGSTQRRWVSANRAAARGNVAATSVWRCFLERAFCEAWRKWRYQPSHAFISVCSHSFGLPLAARRRLHGTRGRLLGLMMMVAAAAKRMEVRACESLLARSRACCPRIPHRLFSF